MLVGLEDGVDTHFVFDTLFDQKKVGWLKIGFPHDI